MVMNQTGYRYEVRIYDPFCVMINLEGTSIRNAVR